MGLDMYLRAERRFPADSEAASAVLEVAGMSYAELVAATTDTESWDERTYLSSWSHAPAEERARAQRIHELAGTWPLHTDDSGGGELSGVDGQVVVQITAGYWRKANAVHDWFVRRCQDGVDDCGEYPVEAEQLAELRSLCTKALERYEAGDLDGAGQLMTPTSGFFFGSTDIDDWWASDLRDTVATVERVVHLAIEAGGVSFSYHSSW